MLPSNNNRTACHLAWLIAFTTVYFCGPQLGSAAEPSGFTTLAIGDPAPPFRLKGIDDLTWSLDDFKSADVLMIYFTSNHCPVCHAQDPRLVQLVNELSGKSFSVVAINPNSGDGLRVDELGYSKYDDSFEHMKLYAHDESFTFPYLYDGDTQETAKAYGCLATPHVFVFDKNRNLQYQGWLDDSRFSDPATVKRQDARDAVLALLAGIAVKVSATKPFGCSTKWREKIPEVIKDNDAYEAAEVTLNDIDAAGVAALAKNPTKKYRLFNVWSTTCVPCVEEFPGLMQLSRRMGLRDFELITISTDLPEQRADVQQFLARHRAVLPNKLKTSLKAEGRQSNNYLYTDASMDALVQALDPQWPGPQPHTVLVAPGGEIVFRHNGKIDGNELLAKVLATMTTTYQP